MRIALIQSDDTENGIFNAQFLQQSIENQSQKNDLWILPEIFDTGWNIDQSTKFDGNNNILMFRQLSQQYKISICGSFYTKDNNTIRNRFYIVTADGREYFCDKRHLFGVFEKKNVTAGDYLLTFLLNDIKFRVAICYDLRFPVWCRNNENYDALLCVSQWPISRYKERNLLMAARAVENVCCTINCNGLGSSLIYSPEGNLELQMPIGKSVAFYDLDVEKIRDYRKRRPYLLDEDNFTINI